MAARFSYLTRSLAAREEAHRRLTLVAIGLLIVLSTSPVYVHHVFAFSDATLLAGLDHVGALCVTALHLLFLPVHRVFHIVILAGGLYAAWDRLRAWLAMRDTLALLEQRAPAPGDRFWIAASAAGIDPHRIRVVDALPNPAFTVGLLTPRVYLSAELAHCLTSEQLEAVVAHEAAHVARRDPLRIFLLRLLACTVFWLPALRRLAEDMNDEAEIRADDAAVRGRPLVLASAILALSERHVAGPPPPTAIGFQRDDLLERRVRRLAGEESPVKSHVTRNTIAAASLALSMVWVSGIIVAHPLPYGTDHAGHAAHCEHEDESAIQHLFCLGLPFAPTRLSTCPH